MDIYKAYYTKSDYITSYMAKMLDINGMDKILEPCAGDGEFIDKILEVAPTADITALELNPEAVIKLKEKYREKNNISIFETDTLFDAQMDIFSLQGGEYDKIIGNPPYGAWQDYTKRDQLKQLYQGHYVKETYTLFLIRCISLLKEGGRLSFIIPDTFLNLHMHKSLRELLLTQTKILDLLIIPSKFFPNVNFGYANLSIITLEKCSSDVEALENEVTITRDLKEPSDIYKLQIGNNDGYSTQYIKQLEIFNSVGKAFLITKDDNLRNLINNPSLTLGEISDCVTGLYTGDNTKFIKVISAEVRYSKSYSILAKSEIYQGEAAQQNGILNGITDSNVSTYIPIVKGNSRAYVNKKEWYINWSEEAVSYYKTDKKARFQNSQHYFKRGISLPMVKSARISASIIENSVFDQSVVGVFPHDNKLLYYILAFLNSKIANSIIHKINPTANNSANYIKKIPIIMPTEHELEIITNNCKKMISHINDKKEIDSEVQSLIDSFFEQKYRPITT